MAEQQRRRAYGGLAFASALVVLIASGVAISRLGSDDRPSRGAETASPAQAPEPTPSGSAAGQETSGSASTAASNGSPLSSASAPVPPPVPARKAVQPRVARSQRSTAGSPASPAQVATAGAASESAGPSGQQAAAEAPRSGSESSPPSSQREPDSSALLAASVSVGEGPSGAVVGAGLGDAPEADVTVGDSRVVGDAPPSDGTAIDLGGRFLHPPPTVPTLPG